MKFTCVSSILLLCTQATASAKTENRVTSAKQGAVLYTEVQTILDSIRSRCGMPFINPINYNTKDKLRKLIHNERRIELAGEGQRSADIHRWGIAGKVMHNIYDITNDMAQQRKWKVNFVKMFYPQTALDHNPNLKAAQEAKGY